MKTETFKNGILRLALVIAVFAFTAASAQEKAPLTPNYLGVAQNFLRTFYPQLSGKNYFMTVNTNLYYDKPRAPFGGVLHLSIGEGPKGETIYIGGCQAVKVAPDSGFIGDDCKPGPVGYKQFLSAGFHFDNDGHLMWFTAEGPATGDVTARAAFAKSAENAEGLTGPQRITALKRAGAKYGPDDKDEFIKNLPTAKLETFLGKMNVVSVGFAPYLEADRSNFSDEMQWDVKAVAKRSDGTSPTYRLQFEQYAGNLVTLCDVSTYPCNALEAGSQRRVEHP
jgi:hypothetical protein